MRWWLSAALVTASASAAVAAPPPPVPVVVAPPPLVKIPAPQPSKPLVKPSEAEALALARAYSPSHMRHKAELAILEKNFIPGLQKSAETAAMLEAFPELGPALKNAMAGQIGLYIA